MKKTLIAVAALAAFSTAALATNGNNGNGNGGCGQGQQTNGCPGNGGDGGAGGAGGAGGDAAAQAQAAAIAAAAAQANSNANAGAVAVNGPNTNQNANTATGGLGLGIGMGGAGGSASSNGTNVGINGQQQGIDRSGNSTNTLGQNTDVRNTSANTNLNGQGQGQGQSLDSRNSLMGGAQTNGQSSRNSQDASTRSGSNNAISVDASKGGDVYTSKTTVWAPVIHGPAAAPLAAANLIVIPGVCGPRVNIIKTPLVGKRFGIWGGQDDVAQGYDYDIEPAAVPFKVIDNVQYGEMVTAITGSLGTSSAGSFSIGGFGKDGNGGQGGAAASGQLQQIVTRFIKRDCVMARAEVAAAAPTPIMQPVLPVVDKVGE